MGNMDKALKDAEVACQLDQQNIKAHYICGCILAEASKKDDAKISKAQNRLKKAFRLCDTLNKQSYCRDIEIKLFRLRKLRFLKQQQRYRLHLQKVSNLITSSYKKGLITKQQHDRMLKQQQQNSRIVSNKQIPDHLLCKITLDLIEDPVITEAGFTYEREALDELLKKAAIDPVTRQPIKPHYYPNQALKQAIEVFLEENPWAFQFTQGQSYMNIQF